MYRIYNNSKMGNCNLRVDTYDPTIEVNKNQFTFHHVIGRGGFGKVWKVYHKKSKQALAMKEMSKVRVIQKRSVNSVMNERRLLALLKHPFIVNMQYAFQDSHNLYLAMDLMPGGDLRYHFGKRRRFNESETKFFVACIITGLEYLHVNGIIHRDIKPENLVLDRKGYLRITDFGIARVFQAENGHETSGTPGYMAPEVICRQNHGFQADYFAVGVIAYEFITGKRPYLGKNRREIRDAILAKQVCLKRNEIPDGWSSEAVDFVNKMIQRKPQNRLGLNGPQEVKNHSWLRDYPWQKLIEKTLDPPFKPADEDNFDSRQVLAEWKDEPSSNEPISQASLQSLFSGYFFVQNSNSSQQNSIATQYCGGEQKLL
jgi:serine/threonine protein kinase